MTESITGKETVENAPVYRKRASLDAGNEMLGARSDYCGSTRRDAKTVGDVKHVECKVFTACGACGSHLCVDCMTEWHATRIDDS